MEEGAPASRGRAPSVIAGSFLGNVDLTPAGAAGPDLSGYALVSSGLLLALITGAYGFRRLVGGHLRRRAARRSLQVLDVLPLGGRQKLVVVRCYERSFLLGLGDRELCRIADLDGPAEGAVTEDPPEGRRAREEARTAKQTGEPERSVRAAPRPSFSELLERAPAAKSASPKSAWRPGEGVLG